MMRLHREAPDPLYLQLKDSLVAEITSGRYRSNQRLPSERELSIQFKVSRMTVRQALLELARDGTIYTRVGKGTFVSEPKIDQQLRALTGFSQDVRARGGKPSSRVLEARVVPAVPEVAAALRIAPEAEVILLSRLRLADSVPLAVETAYLPFALFPQLLHHNFACESLYDVLENEYKLALTQAEQSIEAALAGPREIELLELTPPTAVLKMQRLTLTADGVPVEYVLSVYRGDRYKFRSMLQPRNATG
jgi:GntR family transcriptional regulator